MLVVYPIKRVVLLGKVVVHDKVFRSLSKSAIAIVRSLAIHHTEVSSMQTMLSILRSWVFLVNWFEVFLIFAEHLDTRIGIARYLVTAAGPDEFAYMLREENGVLFQLNFIG